MTTATKEAIGVQDMPADFTDINAIPVEQEVSCRPTSNLPFDGRNGIFTQVSTRLNARVNVITVLLKLNPKHAINPNGIVPGCNPDGVMAVAAKSINARGVGPVDYIRSGNRVTDVVVRFSRINTFQPATIGIRVKYEENGGTGLQFNPKVKIGTVSFP